MAGSLFCGRSPAHEAETVREQHPTYNYSTRSGPQRGTSQLILIGRSSEFEGKKYRTRMDRVSLSKIAHFSRPHSS